MNFIKKLVLALSAAFLLYIVYVTIVLTSAYCMFKSIHTENDFDRTHVADSLLAWKPLNGAKGFYTFLYTGERIPICFDNHGFRITENESNLNHSSDSLKRPVYLFMGSSFTFGEACRAEETFAYQSFGTDSGSHRGGGRYSMPEHAVMVLHKYI